MIHGLLDLSLGRRFAVLLVTVALVVMGVVSYLQMPVDAFPDVTNVQVAIYTDVPGLGPLEIEQLITAPIERTMSGLPKLDQVRSISRFGVSAVTVVFTDAVDVYFARTLVLERLQQVRSLLPEGVEPEMGPVSSGLGQVFAYTLESPTRSPTELRTMQDWVINPFLRTVPGVTDVLSQGGFERQVHVLVNPDQLLAYDLTLEQVFDAVRRNNSNVGGKFIDRGSEQLVVRGVGLFGSKRDVEDIVLARNEQGVPIYLKQVASVEESAEIRQGTNTTTDTNEDLTKRVDESKETVTGIVLMLLGENSKVVIARVKDKVKELRTVLPSDVRLTNYYDQSELVSKAIETVSKALEEAIVIVAIVLFVFLWEYRSAFVVISSIPLSILICFLIMSRYGLSANLMSFGGLAIAIGLMVDPAIAMVENIVRHFQLADPDEDPVEIARRASHEVGVPIFYAILIIIVVFLPLITLEGMEGKLFAPLALTIAFAMAGALALTLTFVPVICTMVLEVGGDGGDPALVRWLKNIYRPMLKFCWKARYAVITAAIAALLASLTLLNKVGAEFMPVLDEGSALCRVTLMPNVNLQEATRIAFLIEQALNDFPEVKVLVSKVGRGSLGGDPDPVNSIETYIGLNPRKTWRWETKDELISQFRDKVKDIPGAWVSFSQPIANRVDELVSGVKAAVAIKIFGDDLKILENLAQNVRNQVAAVEGVADLAAERMSGLKQLEVVTDRQAIARFGLNVEDIQTVVETAIGGKIATYLIEGDRRFGVAVRLQEDFRSDVETIRNIMVRTPDGGRVPLSYLARVEVTDAPPQILRQEASRFITVMCNVTGRDLVGFVDECKAAIKANVEIPEGYRIVWGGQFENQQRAAKRLSIVIPICIGLIFLLLFMCFQSFSNSIVVLMNIPFSVIGGILAVYLFDFNLSVPSMVGFIALFGIAIQNGVVMVECFIDLRKEGHDPLDAMFEGAEMRLRPVLMTALCAGLGLVPILLSKGIGSEVQKPLAAVVAGGLFSSTGLTLLVLPLLFGISEGWQDRRAAQRAAAEAKSSSEDGGAASSEDRGAISQPDPVPDDPDAASTPCEAGAEHDKEATSSQPDPVPVDPPPSSTPCEAGAEHNNEEDEPSKSGEPDENADSKKDEETQ